MSDHQIIEDFLFGNPAIEPGTVRVPVALAQWLTEHIPVTFDDDLFDIDASSLRLTSSTHGLPQILLKNTDSSNPDGAGGFIRFESLSSTGTLRDGVQINGGLVDATHGQEDGLLDIAVYRAGTSEIAFTIDAELAAIFPGNAAGVYSLGRASARWKDMYAVEGLNVTNAAGDAAVTLISNLAAYVILQDTGATSGTRTVRLRCDSNQYVVDQLSDVFGSAVVHTRFYLGGGLGVGSSPAGGDPGAGNFTVQGTARDATGTLQAIPRSTTAALAAVGNAINTTNKFSGKVVINTTSGAIVTANGATAASTWLALDGTTAHTPV